MDSICSTSQFWFWLLAAGTVIREEVGLSLDKADSDVLGHAAKVVLTKDSSTIVGDGSTQEEVSKRVAQIKNLIEVAEQDYEKEKLNERIAKLSGGVAVIQVGAQTETELKEKKLRVEDALNATKAAVEEGIVVGGGCTLLRLSSKVDALKESLENEEEKANIVKRALSYPLKLIAKNAGVNGTVFLLYLMAAGIIDPTKGFSLLGLVLVLCALVATLRLPPAHPCQQQHAINRAVHLLLSFIILSGKMESMTGELSEKEIIRQERNAGFISDRVREIQLANAMKKREQKEQREKDLREGLQLYKSAKYEEALEKFESVLGSRPDPTEAAVASYNVACCYSKLNQIQAGLSALADALEAGFEDFKRVRTDPDLAGLRASEDFEPLLKKYDESFINENAINALKSLFGFNKK
nr:ruBisCO large subunit-binding protein subunit beta, chloroplastic [Ipomoea batatas]GMD26121.1 ruBisCO large subunit-binding protein subunit beta, chloroplastic [Ipomoea batatas]